MTPDRLTVLILGGYGTFGGRLAHLLADETRLRLLIGGRSHERAAAFCAGLTGAAECLPVTLDRERIADVLAAYLPDILVDASGPFQAYGAAPYGVVQACLDQGVSYLDLADGAAFVEGISGLDARAAERRVFALAGVSSFPVLTAAVVDELARDLDHADSVTAGIAPSPYAGVGPNVIRAIASYAGQPVAIRRGGREVTAYPMTESRDETIAPPGELPLKTLRFSLVDVPDLRVVPQRLPGLRDVWMGAGPVPEILHRALNGFAWLVRLKLLPSLVFLAPLIDAVANRVRWGEHRGGMFVRVSGRRGGEPAWRAWHLLAEGDDGPLIPSMAAEAIVRNVLDGRPPRPGARSGADELSLADYGRLFAGRQIRTGIRRSEEQAEGTRLYRRILGSAFDELPPTVRALHEAPSGQPFRGEASVVRGRGLLARLAGLMAGFPPAGTDIPLKVRFEVGPDAETWLRDYRGHRMRSVQSRGVGRWSGLMVEHFGPIRVGLALVREGDRLRLVTRRWSVFGIPLPPGLAPGGDTHESEREGRFVFHVEVASRLTGMIVRYGGWLEPAPREAGQ